MKGAMVFLILFVNYGYARTPDFANSYNKIFKSEFTNWGIDDPIGSIGLKPAIPLLKPTKNIIVAVIDTGIDPKHPHIAENIMVYDGKKSDSNYGVDFSDNERNFRPLDTHGHGTHVAGIIKSVYPEVKILPLKFYNANSSKNMVNTTIEALEYAIDHNVDIINYSAGGSTSSILELKLLKRAEEKGILIVAAAGNEKSDLDKSGNTYYPASYGLSNIITVTSYNDELNLVESANYGAKSIDIAAPGNRIKSAVPDNRSSYFTGTSQATAFVTGAAAILKAQNPKLKAQEIREIIIKSAKFEKTLEKKCMSNGRLDVYAALKLSTSSEWSKRNVATTSNRNTAKSGTVYYRSKTGLIKTGT